MVFIWTCLVKVGSQEIESSQFRQIQFSNTVKYKNHKQHITKHKLNVLLTTNLEEF